MLIRKVQQRSWGTSLTTIPKKVIDSFQGEGEMWCVWNYDDELREWRVKLVDKNII